MSLISKVLDIIETNRDKDFNCIDFVTILERKNLDSKLVRKFNT